MAIKTSGTTVIDNNRLFYPVNSASTRAAPTISAGTLTLDLQTATMFDVSLNAAITTLTISNIPTSGSTGSFILTLTADGTARSVTWPGSFRWPGGTAPTLTSTLNKTDIITCITDDGGTVWYAFISGQNF